MSSGLQFLIVFYFLYAIGYADICWFQSATTAVRVLFITIYSSMIIITALREDSSNE